MARMRFNSCRARSGSGVSGRTASTSSSARSLDLASASSGGSLRRSARISGWLLPKSASALINAWRREGSSPRPANWTNVSRCLAAVVYSSELDAVAPAVIGTNSSASGAAKRTARRRRRADTGLRLPGKLLEVEAFLAHSQVEIKEGDSDGNDGLHKRPAEGREGISDR